jgi:phosphoribosylaminoimidazole-succinocarboxamide synthase
VRDYLDGLAWNKQPPPPPLPAELLSVLRRRYIDAYERITDRSFAEWPGSNASDR